MGQREMHTRDGEIVLRDDKEIVCVLCQGADEKTRVSEGTENVLFYGYGIPGVGAEFLKDGLTIAAETMGEFGNGTIEEITVY
jgi:DNA/RNA-binding domain of Phe-tRNA-synthetase-like protein